MVLPPNCYGNRRERIGGGGDIRSLLKEHRHTVHNNHTHHGYVSGGVTAPWGAGVLVEVGKGEPGTGEDAGGEKSGGNGRDGGKRGQGLS